MSHVGFVGLGRMGSRMAARLLKAGYEVVVYNRTREKAEALAQKGAKVASSPAEAAAGSDVTFTNVSDGAALKAVCLGDSGVLSARLAPKLLIDMGTVSPAESAEVAAAAKSAGVGFLRSPVSGSTVLAEAGKLTILASGDREVYDEADPYLAPIGETRYYVGTGESARYLKLVLNMAVAAQVQILAEGLVLGEKAGLDWDKMIEVISNSSVGSPLYKYKAGPLKERNYNPTFSIGLMVKDLKLALAAAREAGVELPVAERVKEFYAQAAEAGLADRDFTAVTLELEKMAGLKAEQ